MEIGFGRINNMAAPVVPIQLASMVPAARIPVFTDGVPSRVPVRRTPPATAKRARSRIRKGMYSRSMVCNNSYRATEWPYTSRQGIRKARPQKREIFPKWWCQMPGNANGKTAMDKSMQAKGTA